VHIAVFQALQLFPEYDGRSVPVAIYEGKMAFGFGGQRGLDQGEDGCNTAACRKGKVMFGLRGVQLCVEPAGGWEHVQLIAYVQLVIGVGGEKPSGYFFYGDAKLLIERAAADGIAAAYLLSFYAGPYGDILSLYETEGLVQMLRYGEGYGDTIFCLPSNVRYL